MTLLGRLISLFPLAMMITLLGLIVNFAQNPSVLSLALFFLAAFGIPVLIFRIHNFFFPLTEGLQKDFNDPKRYSAWWGSHHIQLIYHWLPFLEIGLRLIPGAFSLWLRLWGSQIGQKVFWTPLVAVEDRSLIVIGHGVVFGHASRLISHVVYPTKNGTLVCFVKKIQIDNTAFIGAGVQVGPGCTVESGTLVPVLSILKINKRVNNESFKTTVAEEA